MHTQSNFLYLIALIPNAKNQSYRFSQNILILYWSYAKDTVIFS